MRITSLLFVCAAVVLPVAPLVASAQTRTLTGGTDATFGGAPPAIVAGRPIDSSFSVHIDPPPPPPPPPPPASVPIAGLNQRAVDVTDSTPGGTVLARATLVFRNNGTWDTSGYTSRGPVATTPSGGTWLTGGGGAGSYQILISYTYSGTPDAVLGNTAPGWSSLSTSRYIDLFLPSVSSQGGTVRNRDALATVRIRIRQASTGYVVSDTSMWLSVSTHGTQ